MTINDIMQRALRIIGVVAEDDVMTADQGANAFTAYCDMIAEWRLIGYPAPAVEPTSPNDEFAYPREYANAATHLLAAHLAAEYTRPLTFDPMRFQKLIERANFVSPKAELPLIFTSLPSRRVFRGSA